MSAIPFPTILLHGQSDYFHGVFVFKLSTHPPMRLLKMRPLLGCVVALVPAIYVE